MSRHSDPLLLARTVLRSALLCLAFVACGGGEAPTDPTPPVVDRTPLKVVAGAGQSDTVFTTLTQALIVEVRDTSGKFSQGRTVRFTRVVRTSGGSAAVVSVSPLDQQQFGTFASDVTDAQGRAETLVKLGTVAGAAALEIAVPEFGVVDTVDFTVKPGAAARVTLEPRDTTVQPNATYSLRAAVTDQFSNPLPGIVPTFSASGATVSNGGVVTAGSAFGRATIVASHGALTDTVRASVVPRLPMVTNNFGSVYLINSDGSGSTLVATTSDRSLSPHSVKNSTSIVYYAGDPGYSSRVWVVEPGSVARRLLPTATGTEAWPRLSPDGTWVYFVRNNNSLWRVHLDGTSLDSLTTVNAPQIYRAPTISPDGGTVAIEDAGGVKVVNLATKVATILPVTCGSPRYSPDGSQFACLSAQVVSVVKTDGTGARVVSANPGSGPVDDLSGVDWSPDGKWILVYTYYQGPVLLDVATGAQFQLPALGPARWQMSFVR